MRHLVAQGRQVAALKPVAAGQTLGPDDAYATLRGMRTLGLRLERHQSSAARVAAWFQQRDEVTRVLYPDLPDHPGHAIWQRDASGTNATASAAARLRRQSVA